MAVKHKDICRIIDANFNRSKEGLRVCEEVARFALNDKKLTVALRRIRHRISVVVQQLPVGYGELLKSRNSGDDLGKNFYSPRPLGKVDYKNIFLINLQRVKEALRVLEEFCAFLDKKSAQKFQNLRFKVYGLEKITFERF